jgi:cytochrome c biogenesis protein CcmG/thiol:disulfide interchange protein DsbE
MSERLDASGERQFAPLVILPFIVFLALAGLFFIRLYAGDASKLPSALIGKPVPDFALPAVDGLGRPGLASTALKTGKVTLLNVFASWCGPCREEQPALNGLAKMGLPIVGLAYKDKAENTVQFLKEEGNPYSAVGADLTGRTAIDFGVYGVPETYVVKGDGTIAYKIVGPLTDDNIKNELVPAIKAAGG